MIHNRLISFRAELLLTPATGTAASLLLLTGKDAANGGKMWSE
jgi:hypothetical protein